MSRTAATDTSDVPLLTLAEPCLHFAKQRNIISMLADLVQTYKALGHPARLRIVAMLRTGELCACQITAVLDLAPSTVSAHLAELRRAGLLTERKDGRWVYYRLSESDEIREIIQSVSQRIKRDPQIRDDAAAVRRLRSVPIEKLCRADLDISRLTVGTRKASRQEQR